MAEPQSKNTQVEGLTASDKKEALLDAAEKGNKELVELLIKESANIEAVGERKGNTPLINAAHKGHNEIVKLLIESRANIDAVNNTGDTALIYAAHAGHNEVILTLIKANANTEVVDNHGYTALFLAAYMGHSTVVSALLRASTNTETDNTQKALLIGASRGHNDVVSAFIQANVNIDAGDNDGSTALHGAACNGQNEVVKILLQANASINSVDNNGYTALHLAASSGHNDVVSTLIKANTNIEAVDNFGNTPLLVAACGGHNEVISTLITAKANIDAVDNDGGTALIQAADSGHNKAVSTLTQLNANIEKADSCGNTALIVAARKGHNEVVLTLIQANANIDASDKLRCTPLTHAVSNGHNEVVNTLIKAKANIDIALHHAASEGHNEYVKLFLRSGANIDGVGYEGKTALIEAACNGHNQVVCTLINANADTEIVDSIFGYTALLYATAKSHNTVVSTLLNANANIDAVDKYGRTLLIIAASYGNIDSVETAFKAKANIDDIELDEDRNTTSLDSDKRISALFFAILKATKGIVPSSRLWQDFFAFIFMKMVSYIFTTHSSSLFVSFLQHCPYGKHCCDLWKSCSVININEHWRRDLKGWIQKLPKSSYFKLAIEKGVRYLICTFDRKLVQSPDFWHEDGQLMQGILYDLPDDMWSNNTEKSESEVEYLTDAGLQSDTIWDLNPRLNYAQTWDRSNATGLVTTAIDYRTLNLFDTNDKVAVRELQILKQKMSKLHGYNDFSLVEAKLVCNDTLNQNFGNANRILKHRHQGLPRLFKKQDWREDNINKEYNDAVYKKYDSLVKHDASYDDANTSQDVPVILMVHGTTQKAAYSIVQAGFGTVSALDAGYYGQGIYFTTSIQYACSYDLSGTTEKTLILSLVTPGNVYPVKPNDKLRGQPIKPGYQSHYTLVDRLGRPLKERKLANAVYDELVVAQDVQAVARYIIKVVQKPKQPKTNQTKSSKKEDKHAKHTNKPSGKDIDDSDDELSDTEDEKFISKRKLWASTSPLDEAQKNKVEQEPAKNISSPKGQHADAELHFEQASVDLPLEAENLKQANTDLAKNNASQRDINANQKDYIVKLAERNDYLKQSNALLLAKIAKLENELK